MTYQQAIADAIRLFLTTDVDAVTTAAVTGSGLSFFCPAAVDAATDLVSTTVVVMDADATAVADAESFDFLKHFCFFITP